MLTLDASEEKDAIVKILGTERLTLRELSVEDAAFMLRLLNEPSFVHFVGDRGVRTNDDARNYLLKGPIDSYNRFGFGLYLVELRDEKIPISILAKLGLRFERTITWPEGGSELKLYAAGA